MTMIDTAKRAVGAILFNASSVAGVEIGRELWTLGLHMIQSIKIISARD